MAVAASIRFVQGATDGGPGRALIGAAGNPVVASNAADTPDVVSWTWEWIDVAHGSALPVGVVQDGPVPTYGFTPDVQDSYLLHLTVKDRNGNVAEDFRAFTVLRASTRYVPPYRGTNASMNYGGAATGWSVAMYAWLNFLDGLGGGGGVPGGASGNVQFNNGAGGFAGDSVINRSGVGFRDVGINSTHLLTLSGGLNASLDGATLQLGTGATSSIAVGQANITTHVSGGDTSGGGNYALLAENPVDGLANPANVLRLKGGSSTTNGSVFLEIDRHDNTTIAAMSQSGAAHDELTFAPTVDNKGSIGTNALRWALVRAAVVTQGDSVFECRERDAHWVVQEERERMTIFNRVTGRRYAFVLEEIGGDELPPPL
jgi:hypothetical protein